MLFSEDTEKLQEELQGILPFGSSFEFEGFRSILLDTEERYILTLTGEPLYRRICGDECAEIRKMCRKAVANIAVYEHFTLLNTKILPGGFARLTGENTSSLYKYQEVELKRNFRRDGFDELDRIVGYLLKNIGKFPEFMETGYYQKDRGELVPDRIVFSRYYKPVGHIVFCFMKPFLQRAETLDLSKVIPVAELKEAVLEGTLTDKQKQTLELARPLLVCLAVAYAIEDKGINITDTGVWLENKVAGDGLEEQKTAGNDADNIAGYYRRLAGRYTEELQKFLSGCDHINPFIRNNDGKKTVWL